MEKQKRWQMLLILSVLLITFFNILPTVFYYSKPLKKSIDKQEAFRISQKIIDRVNNLEKESLEWVSAFCKDLHLSPLSIRLDNDHPSQILVSFKESSEADIFRRHLSRAGNLIGFVPAQLSIFEADAANKIVTIQRKIPLHLSQAESEKYFQFGSKRDSEGNLTPLYKNLVNDRVIQIGTTLAGTSENAQYVQVALNNLNDPQSQDILLLIAQKLTNFVKTFEGKSAIGDRYFASFTQIDGIEKKEFLDKLQAAFENFKIKNELEIHPLTQEKQTLLAQGKYLDETKQERLELLISKGKTLQSAISLIQKNSKAFLSSKEPWNYTTIRSLLKDAEEKNADYQVISMEERNPFIEKIIIDRASEKITLTLHPEIQKLKKKASKEAVKAHIDQFIYNEIAIASRQANETITPFRDQFEISLSHIESSKSFLTFRLFAIAQSEMSELCTMIGRNWNPQHPDLQKSVFPVMTYEAYESLPLSEKKLGLVVYAPSTQNKMPQKGLHMNSIYVIAKGVDKILQKVKMQPDSQSSRQFIQDINNLYALLQKSGFIGYSGTAYALASEFQNDFIFSKENFFQTLLNATREDFTVQGTKRYAVLEFTDVEQRIATENKIEDRIHEELLKWRDDYRAAQVDLRGISKFDIAPPTKNALWENIKLSFRKYFRGDKKKILHWGLDMSGGKTVQIQLRDSSNKIVTNETDVRQVISELSSRVNKMGVSEVNIRQEGDSIALDFPGSQALSASELVKASSMYFNIVNEKFMTNPLLAETTNQFLQEVWNEAVVTNHKDLEDLNLIAYRLLYGDANGSEIAHPQTEAAKILYNSGLRMANPEETEISSSFNDVYSKITAYKGSDVTEWKGQTNPLLIVFRNHALEGSELENIRASYDVSQGNFLSFGVKKSQTTKNGIHTHPREDFHAWTSHFSMESIAGTPLEAFSKGRGWRMAVTLNDGVIIAPPLQGPLKESASITGSFTQNEISKLQTDLQAGSLSFTPRILSEKNVSPELGSTERLNGIIAMVCALLLVTGSMIAYYRFGGVVASIAVLFNLVIMWAALQNIGATLSLAGIAGIILTVAMAVDANVLVFERIREEFEIHKRIAPAVYAGYRKAFSAILDSNITTLIAAAILLHFDSGPIRGFAVTLIIGLASSLFTALFMTRYFFAGWVQNPRNKQLKMSNWIRARSFNFLKFTKPTVIISSIVIVLGTYLLVSSRNTILGMDFTGGYALNIDVPNVLKKSPRESVEKALIANGFQAQDFQIRELNSPNNLRIFLSRSLEESGKAFAGLAYQTDFKEVSYGYENYPRIIKVVDALKSAKIEMPPQSLENLDKNWSSISGQMSESMRTNALTGITIALVSILIYITVRFEFKYAISATICLAHDVVFCAGAVALLHKLGVPVQIDLHTVAALMTIVGYSLNDTIIVFDRIREDAKIMKKHTLTEVINHALNVTLSRTLMTSGTTLLVLIPLVILGGSTIFGFALVMIIGVVFGTLSSLFIAAPLMQYFHQLEIRNAQTRQR